MMSTSTAPSSESNSTLYLLVTLVANLPEFQDVAAPHNGMGQASLLSIYVSMRGVVKSLRISIPRGELQSYFRSTHYSPLQ